MPDETVLAFDFGLKRIGVAVGERRLAQARPLMTIHGEANETRFAAIAALIAEWQPAKLVVGRPVNDDGSGHVMTARCERFAQQLRGRFHLPVELADERFSSLEADARQRESGKSSWRERKETLDAEAASVILQAWFQQPAIATMTKDKT